MKQPYPITIDPQLLYLKALDYAVMLLREDGTNLRTAIANDLCELRNVITGQPYTIWDLNVPALSQHKGGSK